MVTTDIREWLSDQFARQEAHARKDLFAVARATAGGEWDALYGYNLPYSLLSANGSEIGRLTAATAGLPDGAEDQHAKDVFLISRMVRLARARAEQTLAEVAAKRRILAEYDKAFARPWAVMGEAQAVMARCIRLLALPYADRPGFDPSWEVTE